MRRPEWFDNFVIIKMNHLYSSKNIIDECYQITCKYRWYISFYK